MLNYDQLKQLLAGDTVAIRGTATLEPAGGLGDKIFPPTHALDEKNKRPEPGAKYAFDPGVAEISAADADLSRRGKRLQRTQQLAFDRLVGAHRQGEPAPGSNEASRPLNDPLSDGIDR